jgi:membrane-bound ClpP family serine protease
VRVNQGLIVLLIVVVVGFIIFAIWRTVWAHRRKATTGREELIGKTVITKEDLAPEGIVFLEGERWNAKSESGPVKAGEEIVVTRVDGLKLYVTRKKKEVTP